MKKKYKQLTQEQRYKIQCLKGLGYNQSEIAKQVGCDKSTISRELRRKTGKRGIGDGVHELPVCTYFTFISLTIPKKHFEVEHLKFAQLPNNLFLPHKRHSKYLVCPQYYGHRG